MIKKKSPVLWAIFFICCLRLFGVETYFLKCVFLFGGHLGLGFWRFVSLTSKMQQAVDNDAMEFVKESGSYLLGIGRHSIKRNVYIAIHARTRAIIKGDDVGIVVVLEKLLIDGKDLLVVAEDIVEVAYRVAVLSCGTLDPLFDFADINGGHGNVVSVEGNHISLKFIV